MSGVLARAPELSPGAKVGSYVVSRVVGQGGWGTVYQAQHPAIGSRVAIKILAPELAATPEAVARFFNEAKAANLIKSDHVVSVQDFGQLASGSPT